MLSPRAKRGGRREMSKDAEGDSGEQPLGRVEVKAEILEAGVVAFCAFDDEPRYSDPTLRELVSAIACAVLAKSHPGE